MTTYQVILCPTDIMIAQLRIITFCLGTMALEDEAQDDLVCCHMAFFHDSSHILMPQPKLLDKTQ